MKSSPANSIKNIETSDSECFSLDNLPNLSLGKNTKEQIELCFAAYKDKKLDTSH